MTTKQSNAAELARIADVDYHINQASAEGAALRGEFGTERQLIAMSAQYSELKAAGKLDEARAVRARAIEIDAAAKQQA